jgi:hypothetical protein
MITPVGSQYYWKDRHEAETQTTNSKEFSAAVGRALRRAAKAACKVDNRPKAPPLLGQMELISADDDAIKESPTARQGDVGQEAR